MVYNTEMATNYEVIEHEGKQARRYSDGSIRNERGHMLAPLPGAHTISKEDASTLALRKQERKRQRIEAGALAAVQDKLPDAFTGDDGDWIEAVAQQVAYKALDRLDPKQVDAARFLLTEAGIAEAKQPVQATSAEAVTDILREVASIAASLAAASHGFDNGNYRKHDVIDADTEQAGGEDTGKDDGG
jgi:hypothetical protein